MIIGLVLLALTVWIVCALVSQKTNKSKNTTSSTISQTNHNAATANNGGTRVKNNTHFSVNAILNKQVFHKTFGLGTVVDIGDASKPEEKYITVKFDGESKKLLYPMVFATKAMTLCDVALREQMEQCLEISQKPPQTSTIKTSATGSGDISVCTGNCSTCKRDVCIEDKYHKVGNLEISTKTTKNGEVKMKTGQIIYAKTHAEFLNSTFGTNYKQWMKSVWNYDDNTIVWMVRFNRAKDGWRNSFVSSNVIREENLEHALEWNGRSVAERLDTKRIVIEINEEEMRRKYIFRGVYAYDEEKSNPYAARYYNKISDEFLQR